MELYTSDNPLIKLLASSVKCSNALYLKLKYIESLGIEVDKEFLKSKSVIIL